MKARLVVGVSGGSGAGKCRIIDQFLIPALGGAGLILEHDWYYYDWQTLSKKQGVPELKNINFDRPDAYENSLLARDIQSLREGRAIDVYRYQKGLCERAEMPIRLAPHEVIIVDGMMVLSVPELVEQLDIKAYVHADDQVRLDRRIARDRYFSSEEESRLRFERDVMPAHRQFVEPSRQVADFVLDNSKDNVPAEGVEAFVSAILSRLEALRNQD